MEEKEGKEVERVRFSDEHGSPVHQNGRKGRKGRMEEWKDGRMRIMLHVSRFTFHVLRFTFYAIRNPLST